MSLDDHFVKLFWWAPTLLVLCKTSPVVDISAGISLDAIFGMVLSRAAATRGASSPFSRSPAFTWLASLREAHSLVDSCIALFSSRSARSSAHKLH